MPRRKAPPAKRRPPEHPEAATTAATKRRRGSGAASASAAAPEHGALHEHVWPTIDMFAGTPLAPPADDEWASPAAAAAAARGTQRYARLAGVYRFAVRLVPPRGTPLAAWLGALEAAYTPDPPVPSPRAGATAAPPDVPCDADGEFASAAGQIPLSRLLRWLSDGRAAAVRPESVAVLEAMYALQSPQASPWRIPFLRTVLVRGSEGAVRGAEVVVLAYVYFGRLLFELIADDAIKTVVEALTPAGARTDPAPLPQHPPVYVSHAPSAAAAGDAFTLAGLLKRHEHRGYAAYTGPLPAATVRPGLQLLPYQQQTVQWMLDHERDPAGLNGSLWGEFRWADGGGVYYFPAAGEFRMQRPPCVTGGLLAEEMGLGKTIEVLALALLNPAPTDLAPERAGLRRGRATLVVVPPELLGQWLGELQHNAPGAVVRVLSNRQQRDQVARLLKRARAQAEAADHAPGTAAGAGLSERVVAALALARVLDAHETTDLAELADADFVLTSYTVLLVRREAGGAVMGRPSVRSPTRGVHLAGGECGAPGEHPRRWGHRVGAARDQGPLAPRGPGRVPNAQDAHGHRPDPLRRPASDASVGGGWGPSVPRQLVRPAWRG